MIFILRHVLFLVSSMLVMYVGEKMC